MSTGAVSDDVELPVSVAQARQAVRDLIGTTLLAVGAGSAIRVEPADSGLRLRIESTAPVRPEALRFPLATAVLGRHAIVETSAVDLAATGETVDVREVRVRFVDVD